MLHRYRAAWLEDLSGGRPCRIRECPRWLFDGSQVEVLDDHASDWLEEWVESFVQSVVDPLQPELKDKSVF